MKIPVALLLSVLLASVSVSGEQQTNVLHLGLVNYATPSVSEPLIERTLAAVTSRLESAGYRLEVSRVTDKALKSSVMDGKIDMFVSGAGLYREMNAYGARDLATVVTTRYQDPNHSEGTAIIVRSGRSDLKSFADLPGKRLAALSKTAFPGYQIPMDELVRHDPNAESGFSGFIALGSDNIAERGLDLIRSGRADVLFLKHCLLESYLAEHPTESGMFTVLGSKENPGECRRSTDLYPTLTLATTSSFPSELARTVTGAVLAIEPDQSGMYWGICTDFSSVDRLFRRLKIGPYSYLKEWALERIWNEYKLAILFSVFVVLGLALHSWRAEKLIARKTTDLKSALESERELRHRARLLSEKLEIAQKIEIMTQFSSMLTHEIRQPLSAIAFYLEGLKSTIQSGAVSGRLLADAVLDMQAQTKRIDDIIEKIRNYAKKQRSDRVKVDLSQLVTDAVSRFPMLSSLQTTFRTEVTGGITVTGNPLELEIMIVNVLKNAAEVTAGKPDGIVSVTLTRNVGLPRLTISDNGLPLSEEDLRVIETEVFRSSKAEGFGLGLSIVRDIAEMHRIRLTFTANVPKGLCVTMQFPKEKE